MYRRTFRRLVQYFFHYSLGLNLNQNTMIGILIYFVDCTRYFIGERPLGGKMDTVFPAAASALCRGRRARRPAPRARHRTMPVTFAEIKVQCGL